jgi:hypothetical protein
MHISGQSSRFLRTTPGRLRAVWHYLQENGCNYSIAELSKLRHVAYVFGQWTRRFDISWELHAEAGTPVMLEAIIGGILKGTPLTKSYIASIRKTVETAPSGENPRRRAKM